MPPGADHDKRAMGGVHQRAGARAAADVHTEEDAALIAAILQTEGRSSTLNSVRTFRLARADATIEFDFRYRPSFW
jgi:hypothetical protein